MKERKIYICKIDIVRNITANRLDMGKVTVIAHNEIEAKEIARKTIKKHYGNLFPEHDFYYDISI